MITCLGKPAWQDTFENEFLRILHPIIFSTSLNRQYLTPSSNAPAAPPSALGSLYYTQSAQPTTTNPKHISSTLELLRPSQHTTPVSTLPRVRRLEEWPAPANPLVKCSSYNIDEPSLYAVGYQQCQFALVSRTVPYHSSSDVLIISLVSPYGKGRFGSGIIVGVGEV